MGETPPVLLEGEELLYWFAWSDMRAVAEAATILLRNKEMVARGHMPPGLIESPRVRSVVGTGLVVTYGRPFRKSRGYGIGPAAGVVPDAWVPSEHRELHESILDHRDQLHAHSDADAPMERRRLAFHAGGKNVVAGREPPTLNDEALKQLIDLALKLAELFDQKRESLGRERTTKTTTPS